MPFLSQRVGERLLSIGALDIVCDRSQIDRSLSSEAVKSSFFLKGDGRVDVSRFDPDKLPGWLGDEARQRAQRMAEDEIVEKSLEGDSVGRVSASLAPDQVALGVLAVHQAASVCIEASSLVQDSQSSPLPLPLPTDMQPLPPSDKPLLIAEDEPLYQCAGHFHSHGETVLGLVLDATVLERSLTRLFPKSDPAPSLLRDVLDHPRVLQLLSPASVLLLNTFCGPPSGLNLRNLAWHGFLADCDFNDQLRRVAFFFHKVVGSLVVEQETRYHKVALGQLPSVQDILWRFPFAADLPAVTDLGDIATLIQSSKFVAPGRARSLSLALQLAESGHTFFSLCALLPAFEMSIRCSFVSTMTSMSENERSQWLCGDSVRHYTTLDDFLTDGHTPSALRLVLPDGVVDALADSFSHLDGLRCRDRVAHGALDWMDVSKDVAKWVFVVLSAACAHEGFDPQGSTYSSPQIVSHVQNNYKSSAHPDVLWRKLVPDVLSLVESLQNIELEQGALGSSYLQVAKPEYEPVVQFLQQIPTFKAAMDMLVDLKMFWQPEWSMQIDEWMQEADSMRVRPGFDATRSFGVLTAVVSNVYDALSRISLSLVSLKEAIDNRKARSKQRKQFSQIGQCLPHWLAASRLVLVALESKRFDAPLLKISAKMKALCDENRFSELDKIKSGK